MELTFRDAINRALDEEMRRDGKILITGEDVSGGATIAGFESQDARLPRDAAGNVLPSIYFEGKTQRYRIPQKIEESGVRN